MTAVSGPTRTRARWILAAVAMLLAGIAILLWHVTPLAKWATAEQLIAWIGEFAAAWWAPIATIALFILGGLVIFPITLLIAATAVVFEPAMAAALSLTGVLANALATYGVGATFLRNTMHEAFGRTLQKVNVSLADRGVIAIAVIRMLPVAPFSIVNIAMGAVGIRLRDYVLGTALGIAPGTLALTAFGHQLHEIISHPTWENMAILVAVIAGWIALSLGLQRLVRPRSE